MKLEVGCELKYTIYSPSTLILGIHALKTPKQLVLEEALEITPNTTAEELEAADGNQRLIRISAVNDQIVIKYNAVANNYYEILNQQEVVAVDLIKLDSSIFPYLYPSRYCQSDKLYRFANNKFGSEKNEFLKVLNITDWIYNNVQYLSGATNSHTSAYDTVIELAGVCRDFAHLGIALCRALTIPARYFTGYAHKLNPPDFHACFEAYIGNNWILFDPTKLVPLNGLVKIATGRDAADTAVSTLYGNVSGESMQVYCKALTDGFEPFYYNTSNMNGLSYK
jgi:transglutaminase-like putative cysteine protease